MDTNGVSREDSTELRRYLRDVAALTALPAAWQGVDRTQVAEGLADVLARMLAPDFVYLRLRGWNGDSTLEAVRPQPGAGSRDPGGAIRQALEPHLRGGAGETHVLTLPHPLGTGSLQAAILPIGADCAFGVLVVGSARAGFPGDEDLLLLGVAANQVAVVLQRQRNEDASALLAAIVKSSQDAIISKTLDGVVMTWNAGAERLFGYTAAEMIGRSILTIIPADRQHEEETILNQLRRGERVEHFETVRQSKQGRLIDISLTISPVRDSAGHIIGASKVARDITAQKAAETVLREANQRKDEFLAMLAHELRNPLAPIQTSIHILRAKGPPVPELQRARDVIDRQVHQLTRLVDDLLDVSRINKDKIALKKERVALSAVVGRAVEGCHPLMEKWQHHLTVTLPDEPVFVEGDPARLTQVLMNLLNNAAKYTEPGGRISLTVTREGTEAVLRVKDNGIGIPPHMLERVFEMFTQVDRSLERRQGGLGLGLTLVRRLVEMHGGRVEARSPGSGQGSEFLVHLPTVGPAVEQGSGLSPEGEPAGEPLCRVLIVDDNPDALETLAVLLRLLGYEVHTAHDGLEAVGAVSVLRPDVVLMDIGLPKLNGHEAARRIRQQPGGNDVVLIALTGWGQEEDRRRSREAGFDHHLVKPAEIDELQRLLVRKSS
jgi:PAS domain S-box-containing protein